MQLNARIYEAAHNLISHILRSFLALLGILVGTASVLAIISGGQLATEQALKQFEQLGTNLLAVSLYYDYPEPGKSINYFDVDEMGGLAKQIPELELIAPYVITYAQVAYEGKSINASVAGAGRTFNRIAGLHLLTGREVSLIDKTEYFCVLGNKVYQDLGSNVNLIGQQILLGTQYFTIVGFFDAMDNNPFISMDVNSTIFIPADTAPLITKNAHINHLLIRTRVGADIEVLKKKITDYIATRAQTRLYFESSEMVIKNMKKQRQIFTVFLGFIGGISLLVGGVGVMNIMLISISERRQEIGIRMAVGANRLDIMLLFLTEAMILSSFGGGMGIIIGEAITFGIAAAKHWTFHVFFFPIFLGFNISMLTGMFFGFYPAYKASKLKPIETLRAE